MSQARLHRSSRRSRVKTFNFSPGRMERLQLFVWSVPKAGGLIKVKLTGRAYVACGAGNEHHPELEAELVNMPTNADAADFVAALAGDEDAATRLAEELEDAALADWYDPCEAEGLDEDDD